MNAKQLTVSALAATLALGAAATPSLARDMRGDGQERGFVYLLKTSDANKDGKITQEEVAAFQDGRFEEIDVNGDGVITPGEFSDYRKAQRQAFRDANPRPDGKMAANSGQPGGPGAGAAAGGKMANNDGQPRGPGAGGQMAGKQGGSDGQGMMQGQRQPNRIAMNGDGPQHRMGGKDGQHHGKQDQKWGGQRGNVERIFFVRADTDRSGQVSQEEFADLAAKMFARMDRDGDMVITIEDLPSRPMR